MKTNLEKYIEDHIEFKFQQKIKEYKKYHSADRKFILGVLDEHIQDAKDVVDDFKESQLTLNSVESEGAYRALITLKNDLNDRLEDE